MATLQGVLDDLRNRFAASTTAPINCWHAEPALDAELHRRRRRGGRGFREAGRSDGGRARGAVHRDVRVR